MSHPFGRAHSKTVGAHVRPVGAHRVVGGGTSGNRRAPCREYPPSKTLTHKNSGKRSVSGVIAQTLGHPLPHGRQSGHRPGLQPSTRQRAGHWITSPGRGWPPVRPPARLATRHHVKGRAPWAPATVPGHQRQQGHRANRSAAKPPCLQFGGTFWAVFARFASAIVILCGDKRGQRGHRINRGL